jgi:hypothetical protein
MTDVIKSIRTGLIANLAGITGVQLLTYLITNPTYPAIWVYPDETDYYESEGTDARRFVVELMVGTIVDQRAQEIADGLMGNGAGTVKTALESDVTLDGLSTDLVVRKCSGYRYVNRAGVDILAVQWTVDVSAPND